MGRIAPGGLEDGSGGSAARGVACDFNNLLTVIMGSLELAEKDSPVALQPLLVPPRTSAQRGAVLTQRLLAFSREQALQPKSVGGRSQDKARAPDGLRCPRLPTFR